jgi:hypothetical protein
VVAPGAAVDVAAIAPMAFRHAILFMKLIDNPTIISVVGVALVEDAVPASSILVVLGAVFTVVILLGLRREDSSLLALRVLWLGLGRCRVRGAVHEEPPFLSLGTPVGDLEDPDTVVNSSFMDNFSFILTLTMPAENTKMTSSLEIRGILFHI